MTQRDLLILVDGHALAFRAFHALAEQNLRASNGEPTYAVFGFTQIVLTALQERHPEYVAVSFDVGRTFRDDMYAEYKAGRGETPGEFHIQLDRMKQVLGALNIPIYTANGFEADDVIGTLSEQATAKGLDTLILTGDSDTLQLVNDQVHVLMAVPFPRGATKEYDLDAVTERYKGLSPKQLTDLRGLKGDTSDNIPGVKGIGEAGAIGLLNTYGTVERLYDCLEGKVDGCEPIPNRYRKHLDGQRAQAEFSKKLATIVCDVPVTLDLNAARLRDYDRKAVIELFQQLEFGMSLIKKLPGSGPSIEVAELPPMAAPAAPAPGANGSDDGASGEALPEPPADGPEQLTMFDLPEVAGEFRAAKGRAKPLVANMPEPEAIPAAQGDYKTVVTPEDLAAVVAALKVAPAFAFDTETDRLSAVEAVLVGVSISTTPGSAWYIPVAHREGQQLSREQVVAALKPFFEDGTVGKYGHNAKFDMEVLRGAGITVRGVTFDSTIAATLLNKQAGLKSLAFYELQLTEPMTDIDELIGRGKAQITFDQVPIERAAPYAAADADMTFRLVEKLRPQLAEQERVEQIFERLELPLIPVLVDMEYNGIKLDEEYIRKLGVRLGERIAELEKTVYSTAGQEFNINSGPQLNDILFEKLKLSPSGLSKTKNGGYSLTAEVMDKLAEQPNGEIVRLILQYRQLTKLKSTYVDSLPDLINPATGRVHTTYNQVGAATGRLSSQFPNLQNIPVRTEEGREIRRAFVSEPGHTFVAADYSQIELRVLAHVTRDPTLVDVFTKDQDIHAATAAALFGVPMNKVDKNQRRVAKCVAAGTLINTDRGIIPIEQLGQADVDEVSDIECIVAQEGNGRRKATGFYNNGIQPTIRITTERGYVLEATAGHRVRSLDAEGNYIWKKLGELAQDDYVALARGGMLFGQDQPLNISYTRARKAKLPLPEKMTPTFARFLGYYVSEGSCQYSHGSSTVSIANNNAEVLADLRRISLELFGELPHEHIAHTGVVSLKWHSSRLVELLEQIGTGKGAANKRVPDAVMQGSYESVTEFLRAYFEGDGSISKSFISAGSKSYTLMQQLQTMLLNLGIVCYLEYRDIPEYDRHYKLRVMGRDGRRLFAEHVGFISERKRSRLAALLVKRQTHEAITLPFQRERLMRLYPQTKSDLKETIHMCVRTKSRTVALTYRRLSTILEQFPNRDDEDYQTLQAHNDRNLFYDRVASIEFSQSQVYDLVVPETHTYIANGFVSHNTVVFGVIYGISSFGLAPRIGVSRSEAQQLIDGLFERYPGLRAYIDNTLDVARREGYVQSLFGRRRYFPELRGGGGAPGRKQAAEREAINAPIQATSADIMKLAMINVAHELRQSGLRAKMLLQVHDELILEAPDDEVQAVARLVRETMERAYTLHVPLRVDVEAGRNWEEMKDVEVA